MAGTASSYGPYLRAAALLPLPGGPRSSTTMREGRLARPGGQNSSAAVATRGGMTCCAFDCSGATLQASVHRLQICPAVAARRRTANGSQASAKQQATAFSPPR